MIKHNEQSPQLDLRFGFGREIISLLPDDDLGICFVFFKYPFVTMNWNALLKSQSRKSLRYKTYSEILGEKKTIGSYSKLNWRSHNCSQRYDHELCVCVDFFFA